MKLNIFFYFHLLGWVFICNAWTGEEIKEVEEVEGYQTKEENEKEAEDHLGSSHDHIHFDCFSGKI